MNKVYGYARVSTNKQIINVLGFLAVNGRNCSCKEVEVIAGKSTLKRENEAKNLVGI